MGIEMYKEIRIAGFGGQGVVLAGYILGKAMSLYDRYEAVMTQSYGPEARGGASSANIVVSDEPIDFPFVQKPDILVAISQEAYNKFCPSVKPDAIILIDQDLVNPLENDQLCRIPATNMAERLGQRIVTNVVMVGFFTAISSFLKPEAVEEAIRTSVKPNTIPLNLEAFAEGYTYGIGQQTLGSVPVPKELDEKEQVL
jgi:2-oxoglutarate ferredoxin oxidoreductase subunit gamma